MLLRASGVSNYAHPVPWTKLGNCRRESFMMSPPSTPNLLDPIRASPALTPGDAERVATAIEAEHAPSSRRMCAGAWRQWERWCQGRGLHPLQASPGTLAAFLAKRAEAGLSFGSPQLHQTRFRRTAATLRHPRR
jgi:hypothetical protein